MNVTTFTTSTTKHEYLFDLKSIKDVKATLVWTDPPSSTMSTISLVNDLDLTVVVIASDEEFRPNG